MRVFYNIFFRNWILLLSAAPMLISGCGSSVQPGTLGAGIVSANSETNQGSWDLALAFPGAGDYTGVTNTPTSSQLCSGVTLIGVNGAAICEGASGGTNATAANVLTGTYFWNSSGTSTVGTMTNQGALNLDTTAIPGSSAGYYSSISSTLTNATVCSSKNLFGSAGTAVCEGASGGTNATASNVLTGTYFWNSSGTSTVGTMSNRGALDASASFPGSGYYNGTLNNAPAGSVVCTGTTIFGTPGSATCGGSILTSTALRDAGTIVVAQLADQQTTSSQLTVSAEVTTYAGSGGTPNLPTTGGYNYRSIPDEAKDDDGYQGITQKYAPRPGTNCGTSGSITTRIADCVTQNAGNATWDGSVNGSSGQSVWKLVTRSAANKEVWQDQRTGLLWSSLISTSTNWCKASGNTQNAPIALNGIYNNAAGTVMTGNGSIGSITGGSSSVAETITVVFTSSTAFTVKSSIAGAGNCGGNGTTGTSVSGTGLTVTPGSQATYTHTNYCSLTITQGAVNFATNDTFTLASTAAASYSCAPSAASGLQPASPISWCTEGGSFDQTANGTENWATGTYVSAKGGMGAASTDKVYWRLPTINDYEQAAVDGIRMVMPDMGIAGASRPAPDGSTAGSTEWSASLLSSTRYNSWYFSATSGVVSTTTRPGALYARCVGR